MNRLFKGIAVLCALSLPVSAIAIVPDPSLSTTPDCIRLAVLGNFDFGGQVIGTDGNPLGNQQVRLIISGLCTAVRLCPDDGTPPQFTLTTTSDAMGNFVFVPAGGGCCSETSAAEVHADPGDVTLLPIYNDIGSPDNGGDGVAESDLKVTLPDFSRFSASFLSSDDCYDYTITNPKADDYCDGLVRLADFAIFSGLFQDDCAP